MADSIEKLFITAFSESWAELTPQMLGSASTLGLLALREVSGDGVEAALAVAATWSWGFFTECSGSLPGAAICLFKSEDGTQLEKLVKQATDGLPKPGGRALLKGAFTGAAKRLANLGETVSCGDITFLELSGQEKRLAAIVGNKAWVGTFALNIGAASDTQALLLYAPNGSLKGLSATAPAAEQAAAVSGAAATPAPTVSRRTPRREEPTVRNIERLLGMELEVIVRFGTTNLPLREVVRLGPGMMIELNRAVDEPVELLVNGRSLARGEVVVIDGYYGVRITEIGVPSERPLNSFRRFCMTFDKTQWPAYLALLGTALTGYALAYRLRQITRQQQAAATALTQRLSAVELRLHYALEQTAEQTRRLALLELHLHQNSAGGGLPNNVKPGGPVTGMTERRHRVLVLARRGMDAELIAETLGVPKGEIELIISLSSLKAAA